MSSSPEKSGIGKPPSSVKTPYRDWSKQLEGAAVALRRTGNGDSQSFDFDALGLYKLLDTDVLSTPESYRCFLHYRGPMAQLLVDMLQWVLKSLPYLEGQQKNTILQALLRLSKQTKCLPTIYELQGAKVDTGIYRSHTVDVYRGTYQGRPVSMKKYRHCTKVPLSSDYMAEITIKETILLYNHSHPNLLPFEGIARCDDGFEDVFLVSPYLKNGDLVAYLARHPETDRLLLFRDVVNALVYVHGQNIVHGDIKGCNVLVDACGRAVLADLGLSRLSDAQLLTWTSIQTLKPHLGTLPWLAPELMRLTKNGPAPTTASDIYALGCLAYEVFAGQQPFLELCEDVPYYTAQYNIFCHVFNQGERPRKPALDSDAYRRFGLTEELWELMEACWARVVERRPTATELLERPPLNHVVDTRPRPPA